MNTHLETTRSITRSITVLGAAGRVGRLVTAQALDRGLSVTALVRDPSRLPAELTARGDGLLRVVHGELDDVAAMRAAVSGSQAIVVAVGVRYRGRHPWSGISGRPDVAPTAVRSLLAAGEPWQRVVLLSAFGAGDSWRALPAVVRAVISTSALKISYSGLTQAEQLVRSTGWRATVARAVTLTDGPATGRRVQTDDRAVRGNPKVSRADVARLLLDLALADDAPEVVTAA